MLGVSFLSEIDLFKHLPDSCLEVLEKDSNLLNCSAGYLFSAQNKLAECSSSWRRARFTLSKPMAIKVNDRGASTSAIFGVMGCFGRENTSLPQRLSRTRASE
jgi:hypothetical protein